MYVCNFELVNYTSIFFQGIIQFNQHIKLLEREDPEVARLALLVKNYLIPPLNMPAMNMPHPR